MTNGLIKIGGIGGIIWLVGIILSSVGMPVCIGLPAVDRLPALTTGLRAAAVGGILTGIGVLLLGFVGIGFWQRHKGALPLFTGIFGMIGGGLLLAGSAVIFARYTIIYIVGAIFTGIFLILLGLVLAERQDQLNTRARLGIDLAYPATLTTFIAGCTYLAALVTPAAPAAMLCTIVFLLAR